MKKQMKVLITILIAVVLMVCNNVVYAENENFSVSLTTENTTVEQGGTVDVIVGIDDFVDVGNGIMSFMAKLVYDTNKLEIDSTKIVAQNEWDTPTYENNNVLTLKSSLITTGETIMKMTFTVKANATLGETRIRLENPETSNDEDDFIGTDGELALTIVEPQETPTPGDTPTETPTPDDNPTGGTPTPDDNPTGGTPTPDDNPTGTPTPDDNPTGGTPTPDEQPTIDGTTVIVGGEKDDTISDKKLPAAGINTVIIGAIIVIATIAIVMYKKYKKYQFIK